MPELKLSIHVILNVVLIIACLLTVIAIFSPGWRVVDDPHRNQTVYRGLIHQDCAYAGGPLDVKHCLDVWGNAERFEKFIFVLYMASVFAMVGSIAWSLIMCGVCCCQPAAIVVLPFISLVAYTLHLSATMIYASKTYVVGKGVLEQGLGFSVYIAVVACVTLCAGVFLSTALIAKQIVGK